MAQPIRHSGSNLKARPIQAVYQNLAKLPDGRGSQW